MSVLKQVINILHSRNLDTFKKINQIPSFDTLFGVKEASKIIKDSILQNKKIAIIGDYDVDGITSICIMENFFKNLGYKNIIFKIPNRFIDGYGINIDIVKELDADVYITVDNGISAFEVATFCKSLNKILIISDHHKPLIIDNKESLPEARVIINPNQQNCNFIQKDICGAVVAFYLCGGIKNELGVNIRLDNYTPFLSLAIIADMMPLTSLNRILFKYGISNLQKSNIVAFKVLKNIYGEINAQNISFNIAPTLNSVGRLEDAKIALDFFREKNFTKADMIFRQLIEINNKRKNIQNEITQIALKNLKKGKNFILSYGEDWHEGVLGIVASRLAEEFNISAFCLSLKNGILKGSGRAKGGINLIHSIQKCKDLLLSFGGHSGAVGLTLALENLDKFMQDLDKNCIIDSTNQNKEIIEATLCDINEELLEVLESYEPYGIGNEKIEFYSSNILIIDSILLGKNKEHQRLQFSQDGIIRSGILFNNKDDLLNKNVDISFNIARNKFNEVQLMINDIKIRTFFVESHFLKNQKELV